MPIGLTSRLRPAFGISEFIASLQFWKKGQIEKFESEYASKFENEFGIMFSHGRTGIYALLKVWNLEKDEVICPAYTCVVVQHAIVKSGNIPVFIDCEKGGFNMDINAIKSKINANTRCIIATHLFGFPMDVEQLANIVKEAELKYGNKIYVIQDVAHSFGAKWNNKLVTSYGDASIFGLNVSKVMSSIFGGMAITNEVVTYQRLRQFRKENMVNNALKGVSRFIYFLAMYFTFQPLIYKFVNWIERKGLIDRFVKYFDETIIDFPNDWNQYPCALEARVGLAQLKKYDTIIQKRLAHANHWKKKEPNIDFPGDPTGATYSHCVALVENPAEWLERYRKKGIQLGELIEYVVPYMKSYTEYNQNEEFPIAAYYSKHVINFPVHVKAKGWA